MATATAPVATSPTGVTPGASPSNPIVTSGANENMNVPSVSPTPSVISSEDNNTSMANNTSKLNTITAPNSNPNGGTPVPNNSGVSTVTLANGTQAQYNQATGQMTDMQGNSLVWNNASGSYVAAGGTGGTGTGGTGTSTSTAVENGANPNATGDPLYDSWNASLDAAKAQISQDAQTQISQFNQLYQSTLMQDDQVYQAAVASAQSTFGQAISLQTQINAASLARTQAYGLGGGSALTMPLSFTNAITQNMQAGAAAIQSLNQKLSDAIAAATAAKDKGDNDALSANLNSIDKTQADMRSAMSQVVTEAQDQLNNLRAIQTQQQAQLQKAQTAYIAQSWTNFGDKYNQATDNASKDSIIKQVIQTPGSGLTMADYQTVYNQFETNSAAQVKAAQTAATTASTLAKNNASIVSSAASANSSNANAAKTWAEVANGGVTPTVNSNFFSKADQLMTLSQQKGLGYVDSSGYLTPQGFTKLGEAAAAAGVSRTDFVAQYAPKLYPGSDSGGKPLATGSGTYAGYGLTKQEIDTINHVGTTPGS